MSDKTKTPPTDRRRPLRSLTLHLSGQESLAVTKSSETKHVSRRLLERFNSNTGWLRERGTRERSHRED